MESGVPNSFIPKDAGTVQVPSHYRSSGGLKELITLVSVVLFIASAALGGAAFLYSQYLSATASSKVSQIHRAEAAFDPSLVEQLTRLDDRMHAAQTLLSDHAAITNFFVALNQATLQTVSFQTLNLQAGDSKSILVKMTGVAQSVNSIALQSNLFGQNGVITNPIFSDIDRQSDGVHFKVTALINPATISYESIVGGAAPATSQPQSTSQTPATPSSPFEGPTTQTQQGTQGSAPAVPTTSP